MGLVDGRQLVAGGRVEEGGATVRTASTEIFDPATMTWSVTGSMGSARTGHSLVVLEDGRVLAAGGFGNAGPQATAEIYEP